MTGMRTLLLLLSLALAFTLGLLARRPGASVGPGPEYFRQTAQARDIAARLQVEASSGSRPVLVAARLRPSVVSIQGSGVGVESAGSGLILDSTGNILTNLHVVQELDQIVVTLSSHERYLARVVGWDEPTDLAVLRISAGEQLYPVEFADSDALEVGQEVLAVGNAFGFGWSVTHGIISSLHRSGFRNRNYTDYIQTDAAINPGNSGGPLVDMSGRVIGVNSVIVSDSGSSAGIGFALPSRDAQFVAEQLVSNGSVQRGYLGVEGRSLKDEPRARRRQLGADMASGVLVDRVVSGTPAATAGFRAGDIILEMDGQGIPDMQALRSRIARSPVGRDVGFRVIRNGEMVSIQAAPGPMPALTDPR